MRIRCCRWCSVLWSVSFGLSPCTTINHSEREAGQVESGGQRKKPAAVAPGGPRRNSMLLIDGAEPMVIQVAFVDPDGSKEDGPRFTVLACRPERGQPERRWRR
jgi:hypothetical protein